MSDLASNTLGSSSTLSGGPETKSGTARARRSRPGVERLETLVLLSTGLPVVGGLGSLGQNRNLAAANDGHLDAGDLSIPNAQVQSLGASSTKAFGSVSAAAVASPGAQTVTTPTQTSTIRHSLTNFDDASFDKPIQLFDPALGTLTGVTISRTVTLAAAITTKNLSPSSPALITLKIDGTYSVTGLGPPLVGTIDATRGPFTSAAFDPANPNANLIGPVTISGTDAPAPVTLTSPSVLALFTGSGSKTPITPTMTASGFGTTTSTAGATETHAVTGGEATVSVSYTYIPANPACPTPGKVLRFGVHHQPTLLVLTFVGTVDPAQASNPANYVIIGRNGQRIPIVSATFNPATNSVTLVPAKRLNIHNRYDLSVNLPCAGESHNVLIPFGGKQSLGGFLNHRGQFVPVVNGHIIRRGR